MNARLFVATAIVAALSPPAAADDLQLWTAVAANGPAAGDSRLLLWFDGVARFRDDISDLGVSIIRPGLGWKFSDDISIWAGYARVVSRRDLAPDVKEDRLWQQATYRLGALSGVRLSGRSRLEQRLLASGDDTGWRMRQLFRFERRLGRSDFSAIGWNETFIAINNTDWGARSGYDQNRAFVGVGWQASKSIRLESGYLLNHIRRENAPDQTNHAISLSLSAAL